MTLIVAVLILFAVKVHVVRTDYEIDCKSVGPLGMISGEITDSQISASSQELSSWRQNCRAEHARLYIENKKSWCAKFKSFSEWLQVDLGTEALITGVMTQGRGDGLEWVSSFMISYSSTGTDFHYIKDDYGSQKVFEGNTDSFTVKHNYFDEPIRARFVKFHTYTWYNHPSLRVEILGCQPCKVYLGGFPYGKLTSSGARGKKKQRSCVEEYGHILSNKGWCSRNQNTNQWLQLDIGPPSLVTALITKGRGDGDRSHWVTHYQISFSNNSKNWFYYKQSSDSGPRSSFWSLGWAQRHLIMNGTVFEGNQDKNIEKIQYLREPFVARFIRFHPVNWVGRIAMRIGLLGCKHKGECGEGFFRINEHSPCIANLAYKKSAWITTESGKMQKRHLNKFSSNNKRQKNSKLASKAIDGRTKWKLNTDDQQDGTNVRIDARFTRQRHMETCTELKYKWPYHESPAWYVNLGEHTTISGVVIYNGYDVLFNENSSDKIEKEEIDNLEKISVYIDVNNSLDLSRGKKNTKSLCGYITNFNRALSKPKIHISCRQPMKGQFVYIQASLTANLRKINYKAILCEVMVY